MDNVAHLYPTVAGMLRQIADDYEAGEYHGAEEVVVVLGGRCSEVFYASDGPRQADGFAGQATVFNLALAQQKILHAAVRVDFDE